jgi:hypothetical protein
MRAIAHVLLLVAATAFAAADQNVNLRPGRYEITTDIEAPAKMPQEKNVECITAEDLKNVTNLIGAELVQDCKMSESKVTGNELAFSGTCDVGGSSWLVTMKMTFASEAFTGVMTATEKGKPFMTVKSSGKRVGACFRPPSADGGTKRR